MDVDPPIAALERLQALRPALAPAAARIAEVILAQPSEVVHLGVTELAASAQSSEGSVTSLCRQLGARGFQHLTVGLPRDLVRSVQAIQEDLDPAALERAAVLLRGARRAEIHGAGSAAPVVEDAHGRLLRIGATAGSRWTATSRPCRRPCPVRRSRC